MLLHWFMGSRVVEVGPESDCGRHRYKHPTKPDDWTNFIPGSLSYLWIKAGSSMGSDKGA